MKKRSLLLQMIQIMVSLHRSLRKISLVVTASQENYKQAVSGSTPLETISSRCHLEDTNTVVSGGN